MKKFSRGIRWWAWWRADGRRGGQEEAGDDEWEGEGGGNLQKSREERNVEETLRDWEEVETAEEEHKGGDEDCKQGSGYEGEEQG